MTKKEIYSIWSGLGVAFSETPNFDIPPERAIIETINSLDPDRDRKMYSLMFLWLRHYEHMIRFEPLYHFMNELDEKSLRTLGAIAFKTSHHSSRWNKVVEKVKNLLKNRKVKKMDLSDERKLSARGFDPDFKFFSLGLVPIAESSSEKLRPWSYILRNNYWIQYRVEGGTNLRSDIRAAFYKRPVPNPYQAAMLIGCLPNSIYGAWKEVAEVQNIRMQK